MSGKSNRPPFFLRHPYHSIKADNSSFLSNKELKFFKFWDAVFFEERFEEILKVFPPVFAANPSLQSLMEISGRGFQKGPSHQKFLEGTKSPFFSEHL